MNKTEIKGDLKNQFRKQLDSIRSSKKVISIVGDELYMKETKLWEHLKHEFPDISTNCTIEDNKDKDFMELIDRLK